MSFTDKYSTETVFGPSLATVRARHRAAVTHRCSCGKLRDPREVSNGCGRRWISCDRCFGTIKQIS